MKEKIILLGGGGHCHSCIDVIEAEGRFEIIGIIDTVDNQNKRVLNYPVIGTDDDLKNLVNLTNNILISIGQIKNFSLRMRKYLEVKSAGFNLPIIISPRAYVSPHARIEEGSIVMHDALINAGSLVGRNCIINSKALIEHDTIVGDFCHISTAAVINGNSNVGAKSFIGSNSVIQEGIIIQEESLIPAGTFWKGKK